MKIHSLLIVLGTVLLAWFVPIFFKMFDAPSSGRLIVYFSSITQHFCSVEREPETDKIIRRDVTTNEQYSLNQFDSVLPLLYYRQLFADGKMPDSIQGQVISAKECNKKNFFFKSNPRDNNSPKISLYPLFESQSGRVDLKKPKDVFRLSKKIAFINPETNKIDLAKTEKFVKVFNEKGFVFPAKLVAGNPSVRKPYDEGYFVVDTEDNLYHFKMVKSQPFLRKVELPKKCVPEYFAPYEPYDRSFYGFLFDKEGGVYVVNTNSYKLQELDCGQIDLDKEILTIMGNPLYWTVRVISREKESVFAFDTQTKQLVAKHHFEEKNKGIDWRKYVFPFELSWTSSLSKFVMPKINFGSYFVFLVNLLLSFLFFFVIERKKQWKNKIIETLWIILTGIFGFVSCLLFRGKE